MLEVDGVGMVIVIDVMDGNLPTPINGEGKVNDANGDPQLQIDDEVEVDNADSDPCLKLMVKAKPKMSMATPYYN